MIRLDSVSELYTLKFFSSGSLEEQRVKALDGVTLEIKDGEALNIIGENGSGKTTLLKVIAGLIDPTCGQVDVVGRASCIMDIGSGFHPELTGSENVKALSPLYGISSAEIEEKVEMIREFADLGKYFNAPLRTYSQGMFLRLAFAFAISIEPDILCVDDIISVGDERVRHKCLEKIEEFKARGVTVLLVTHDLSFARQFSGRTLWMKEGRLWRDGATDSVIEDYLAHIRKDRPLFFPVSLFSLEKETQCPRLFYKNRLLSDPFELSLKIGDIVCDRWEVMEAGFDFLRFQKDFLFYSLEIICSLKVKDQVTLEGFIKDMKRPLASSPPIKICLPVKQLIRALEPEKVKRRDLQREAVYWTAFDQEYLDMRITTDPAWEVVCEEGRKSFCVSGFLEGSSLFVSRQRLFSFSLEVPPREALTDRNKLLPLDFPWIGDESLRLTYHGRGFALESAKEELLEFTGLEILFEHEGREWSSLEARSFFEEEADSSILHLKFSHSRWPSDIHLKSFFKQDKLVFECELVSPVEACSVKNLRIQIFWKKTVLFRVGIPQSPIQIECPSGRKFQIASEENKKAWIFSHPYSEKDKDALVTYLLIPRPENKKSYRMSLSPNLQEFLPAPFFENNFFSFFFGAVDLKYSGNPLKEFFFISFYARGLWHDSKKCLWYSEGEEIIGEFPWIPVKLKVKFHENKIDWKMEMTETLPLDRIQIVFPLNLENWKWSEEGKGIDFFAKAVEDNKPLIYSAGMKEIPLEGESGKKEVFVFNGSGLRGGFIKTLERTSEYVSLNYTWFCETRIFCNGDCVDLGSVLFEKGMVC